MRIGIITEFIERMPIAMKIYVKNLIVNLLRVENKKTELVLIQSQKSYDLIYNKAEVLLTSFDPYLQSKIFDAKIDIIHIPYLIYWAEPFLELLHKKIKVVCTMHGVGHSRLPVKLYYDFYAFVRSELILKILEFYMLDLHVRVLKRKFQQIRNKFELLITVSNSAKQYIFKNFGITEEKIKVIYYGASENFKPLKDRKIIGKILDKYKISIPFILSVGGYNPKKNTIRLIKSFHKFKIKRKMKQKLVIAATQVESVKKIIRNLGLQDEVILTGFIDNNELPELYNAADVFVFPSLHETFGMPILEAMSCGCPVITSNISSMPEIAEDAAVLVNPYNVNEMEMAIYNVLNNNRLREEMIKKGLERAKQFSWRKCAEEHLKVYQEALQF